MPRHPSEADRNSIAIPAAIYRSWTCGADRRYESSSLARRRPYRGHGLVEKPKPDAAPSTLAVIGRYILSPEIFPLLAQQQAGAGGEIQLTDAMAKLIGREPFHGYRFEGERFDCGDKAGFLDANLALALADPQLGSQARAILEKHSARLSTRSSKK
jgi:UTP-glucose-1-phosphate uridylyltransferase